MMRTEKDFLGTLEIPSDAFYGIHARRAADNFPANSRFPVEWYKAVGLVKLAYFISAEKFAESVKSEGLEANVFQHIFSSEDSRVLQEVAREVSTGAHFDHFIVPAISGGAGTSINLNICEIIANVAITKKGGKAGDYSIVDPIQHANIYQSTNDVIPSALHLAVIQGMSELEEAINTLRASIEKLETKHRNSLRISFTQMQEAVPGSWGKLFSTYSEALSRDWWRVSRSVERIKVLNLGAGASGTGMSIPRFVIMDVIRQLQALTGLPLARSENLADATTNQDSLVEVHGMMKLLAVNLEKMVSDLRLLSSDIAHQGLKLPAVQTGSSLMPGKVNPVIPEYVISVAHKVYANDGLITRLSAQSCLELNAYLPIIGCSILESLDLLKKACSVCTQKIFAKLTLDTEYSASLLWRSPSITTALIPYIGYHKAGDIAARMKQDGMDVFEAVAQTDYLSTELLRKALLPENLLRLGYSVREIGQG